MRDRMFRVGQLLSVRADKLVSLDTGFFARRPLKESRLTAEDARAQRLPGICKYLRFSAMFMDVLFLGDLDVLCGWGLFLSTLPVRFRTISRRGVFRRAKPRSVFMSKRVELLYKLQRLDTGITTRKRRYDRVKASLGESKALLDARKALQAAQDELRHWRTLLLDREIDVAAITDKQKETETRLYGGRVKDPKELRDLEKENEYLKRRKASLEEAQLEAMMMVDEKATLAAVANEEYTVVEAAWRTENAELVQEYDALKQELTQLIARRQVFVARVPARDLEEYTSIRKIRKGVAVTMVRDCVCQICHVQIPTRQIDRARDMDEFIYCNGCDRILYVPA